MMSQKNEYLRQRISSLKERMTTLAESTISTRRSSEEYAHRVGMYQEMKFQLAEAEADLKKDFDPDDSEELEPETAAPDPLEKRRTTHKPRSWGG